MFDRNESQGKYTLRHWPKWLSILAVVVLAAVVTLGGTLAWLVAHTEPVTNTFTMGTIIPDVDEKFNNEIKENIIVTNNGSVDAYVRVALVFNWREGATAGKYEDNTQPTGNIVAGTPKEGEDYTFQLGSEWVKGTDGYYYYTKPVASGDKTSSLGTIEVNKNAMSEKYNLDVQVLADSIQAAPTSVVKDTWSVNLDGNGNITG